MDAALDTLLTALYVKIDDMLVKDRRPGHPARLSQSELVCLAVAQARPRPCALILICPRRASSA